MSAPSANDAGPAVVAAQGLIDAGRWSEAVTLLTAANRAAPDPDIEVLLVTARHRMFIGAEPRPASGGPWPPPTPDCFADVHGVPEVAAAELRDSAIAAALQHHGALIVRGLLPRDVAGSLLSEIRRAFDAAEAACEGTPVSHTSPWYVPFEPAEGYDFGWVERHFSRQVGAVLAVEAPRVLFHAIEALEGSGVVDHIAGYLGERPALSAKKTSLRRAGPDSPTEWHQDGSFLGEGIRTVNVWTALTPCGQDAPSIDVFARPFEEIVATGTDDALFDWSVSEQAAQRLERNDVVRPVFEPGDALLFNQLTLHRTGIESTMSQERYALESWFFAPSTYPYEQVPVGL